MKGKLRKRIGAGILTAALIATSFGVDFVTVSAGDTYPYVGAGAKEENQPYQHGYRVEDIMDWSPETDPYGELLRARIPLQDRNAAFAATQANPELSVAPQYLTLTGDYGNSFFQAMPYNNEFSTHIFNFWQYVDQYASWHGMPSVGTPEELNDIEDERNATDGNAWKRRYFEFGLVNLPNPAYTNAAHKNGVLSLGCMFQPRAYQNFEVMLYKDEDGRYPVADKLTELANYYGFDGYFFNMEGRSYSSETREELKAFLGQMRSNGMYIQWYNAGSFGTEMLTSATSGNTEAPTLYANSVFIEYGHAVPGDEGTQPYGLDKYEVAFNGFEAGGNRWSNNFDRMMSDGVMNGSIASLGTDFVQTGLEAQAGTDPETGYRLFTRELDEYQWMAFKRERMWWSGGAVDPTNPVAADDAEVEVTNNRQNGVAKYIAERTVVNGDSFYTDFNTGHGLEYAVEGETSSNAEWSNITVQDILPTWQWWFDSKGTRLSADFDYGTKYRKVSRDGEEQAFDFDLVGAYNGGSSLVVYGDVDAENFLHLYKTDLAVKEDSAMKVTFLKSSGDEVTMQLGVIFQDDPDTVVKLDIADSAAKSDGWVSSEVALSDYAGKQIAAFGLVFDGQASGYQMNVGRMQYGSGEGTVPKTPTGLTVEKAYETGEMVVSWDLDSYADVKQYNIYAEKEGKEIYLGGTYDDIFYIKDIEEAIVEAERTQVDSVVVSPAETEAEAGSTVSFEATVNGVDERIGDVTLVLKAVSKDGVEGEGAKTTYNFKDGVTNIKVDNSKDGELIVGWDGGQADVTVTTSYEKEPRTWTGSGSNGCTISIPVGAEANGAEYTMEIRTADGFTTYDGTLPDHYCAPYDGRIWSDGKLTQPSTSEWHKLFVREEFEGEVLREEVYTRGTASHGELNNDWSVFQEISKEADSVYVKLEDYNGNQSDEVRLGGRMSITVTADENSVVQGMTLQLHAEVKNYKETDAVTWSVSGNTSDATGIDENGLLTVGEDENGVKDWYGNKTIKVIATSVEDPVMKGEVDVTVVPAGRVVADTDTVYKGGQLQFNVMYKDDTKPAGDYTWDVTGEYGEVAEGTTIDANGLLTVASDEQSSSITVTATNKENPSVSYSSSQISVRDAVAVAREDGADQWTTVYTGDSIQYKVTYCGEEAEVSDFDWEIIDSTDSGTKIEEGCLTLGMAEKGSISFRVTKKDSGQYTEVSISSYNIKPSLDLSQRGLSWFDEYYGNFSVTGGETAQFYIKWKGEETTDKAVDWSISGNGSEATSIDANGLLSAALDETAEEITVTVSLQENPEFTVSKQVKVIPGQQNEGDSFIKAEVLGVSGEGSGGEAAGSALDGDDATKWCQDKAEAGWLAIDLGDTYTINRWIVKNCGMNNEPALWNTAEFALEVLKEGATEENLADTVFLGNAENWKEIKKIENTDQKTVVDDSLGEAVTGRYFRLRIDKSYTECPYPAIRIHEFQLFGTQAESGEAQISETGSTPEPGEESDITPVPDTESGAGQDTGTESGAGQNIGTESGAGQDTGTESGAGQNIGTESGAGQDTGTESGAGQDIGTESGAGQDTATEPGAGQNSETNGTEPGMEAETESGNAGEASDTGSGTEIIQLSEVKEASAIQEVIWSVEGNQDKNTIITQDGLLRIGTKEAPGTLVVRAVSKVNPDVSGTAVVTVTKREQSPSPKPEESTRPSESPKPEESTRPSESPKPEESTKPEESQKPEEPTQSPLPSDEPGEPENGIWVTEPDGNQYWYEDGVKQGTEGRGKEIYDPGTDAWYWLDAVDGGRKAVNKDVYMESLAGIWAENADGSGKWVRYDADGRMVKGWDSTEAGTYYFDPVYGTMAKGYVMIEGELYFFDNITGIGTGQPCGWQTVYGWVVMEDGSRYWYEDGVKQGTEGRGKEIYDPVSDAWYWLDAAYGGKKAVNKDVYMESAAGAWAENPDGTGKWVRYDANGHMVKGWNTTEDGTWYFDLIYGTMAKGTVIIDGSEYRFDEVTGVQIGKRSSRPETGRRN